MRELTQDEIEKAPYWCLSYIIPENSDIPRFTDLNQFVYCGHELIHDVPVSLRNNLSGTKPIPRKETNITTKVIEFNKGKNNNVELINSCIKWIPDDCIKWSSLNFSKEVTITITTEVK